MTPRVAILAGHYGPGTGASFEGRDEYTLARRDALMLYAELLRDELVIPMLEPVEANTVAPIATAARWVVAQKATIAVEMHYNSHAGEPRATGNEVVAANATPLALAMDKALATLPNKHREWKLVSNLLLPKLLDPVGIPCVLVEPAFIWEPQVETPEWPAQVAAAVKAGIYKALGVS